MGSILLFISSLLLGAIIGFFAGIAVIGLAIKNTSAEQVVEIFKEQESKKSDKEKNKEEN